MINNIGIKILQVHGKYISIVQELYNANMTIEYKNQEEHNVV